MAERLSAKMDSGSMVTPAEIGALQSANARAKQAEAQSWQQAAQSDPLMELARETVAQRERTGQTQHEMPTAAAADRGVQHGNTARRGETAKARSELDRLNARFEQNQTMHQQGRVVIEAGKTVELINRAIRMEGTRSQELARKLRDKGQFSNEAAVGELYAQMLQDGGDMAFMPEGAERLTSDAAVLFDKMQEMGIHRLPTLDKFVEMKYNSSPEYSNLVARYQNLTGEREWSAVEFNPETIADHAISHAAGLGVSAQDYAKNALAFINSATEKYSFVDAEGTRRYFEESTGIFASVYPDGTIRTYFKPRKGIKYWEGQVKKYGQE